MRIVAIGGGENGRPGTAYETGPFDREILSLTGKRDPTRPFCSSGWQTPMRTAILKRCGPSTGTGWA